MGKFFVLPETVTVKTEEQAEDALRVLRGNPKWPTRIIAVDTETTGLNRQRDFAIIMSLSSGHNRYSVWPEAFQYFKGLLEDPEIKLIMWNANFDTWMLLNAGIDIYRLCARTHWRVYDAMVMHALANDDRPHSLKYAAREYLGIEMVEFTTLFGADMRRGRPLSEILLDPLNEDVVSNYAALDAYTTLMLFIKLRKELLTIDTDVPRYPTLWQYFRDTEVPFTRVLFHCELNGVEVDENALIEMAPIIDRKMLAVNKWFARNTGRIDINLNSPMQMNDLFFHKLGYDPPSYTDKGNPQLAKNWLKRIAADGCMHARKLLEYRDLKKKSGTYIRGLLKLIFANKLHTSFNQTGARTGRLSSSQPNLQNQPPYIRSAYVAGTGYKLFARDYSQLEMRILAHFSQDEGLISAVRAGKCLHAFCAAMMFKQDYDAIFDAKVRDDKSLPALPGDKKLLGFRKQAKALNFGLIYGMGAQKLSRELMVKLNVAKDLIKIYFATFPGIKCHFDREIAKTFETGTTATILGRKRQIPEIWSTLHGDRAAGERKVKNTPIQGSGADITKMAMIKIYCDDYIHACGYRMLLNVHDEVVGKVPSEIEKNEAFNDRFRYLMEHPLHYELDVPLATTGKYGNNWLETK